MTEASRRRLVGLNNAKDEYVGLTTTPALAPAVAGTPESARRQKRDAILKRRFAKRSDEDDKPMVQEEPILSSSSDATSAAPERSASTGRSTPVSGRKLSVALLKRANQGKEGFEQKRSDACRSTAAGAKPILTAEPVEDGSTDIASNGKPQPTASPSPSASSLSALASRSVSTPRRGSKRRDLVMQRLSARKEGAVHSTFATNTSPARSCSPHTLRGSSAIHGSSKEEGRQSPFARSTAFDLRTIRAGSPGPTAGRKATHATTVQSSISPLKNLGSDALPPSRDVPSVSQGPAQILTAGKSNGRRSPYRVAPPGTAPSALRTASPGSRRSSLDPSLREGAAKAEALPSHRSSSPVSALARKRELQKQSQQLRSQSSENRVPITDASPSAASRMMRRIPPEMVKKIRARSLGRADGSPREPRSTSPTDGYQKSTESAEISHLEVAAPAPAPKIWRSQSCSSDERTGTVDPELAFFVKSEEVPPPEVCDGYMESDEATASPAETGSALDGLLPDPTKSTSLAVKVEKESPDGNLETNDAPAEDDVRNTLLVRVDSPSEIRSLYSSSYDDDDDDDNDNINVSEAEENTDKVIDDGGGFTSGAVSQEEAAAGNLTSSGKVIPADDIETINDSIEVPKEATKEAPKEAPIDNSWDATNVYFGEFAQVLNEIKAAGGVNMFDTASWVQTEVTFDTPMLKLSEAVALNSTELPSGDIGTVNSPQEEKKEKEPDSLAQSGAGEVTLGPDQSTLGSGLDTEGSAAPTFTVYTADFDIDDVDQVKSEITRSDAGLTDILGEYEGSFGSQLLASLGRSKPEPDADEKVSGLTLDAKSDRSFVQRQASVHSDQASDSYLGVGIPWSPGSLPPPPPPGTPSKRKRRTPQRLDKQSPNSMKSIAPVATPRASGSKKAHFFGADFVSGEDDKTELAHDQEGVPNDVAALESNVCDNLILSRFHKPHTNRNMSPVSSSVVMQDTKLAEKVDLAISAAASKFEELAEQVDNPPSTEEYKELTQEDANLGAFSTWNQNAASGLPCDAQQIVEEERDPPVSSRALSSFNITQPSASLTSFDTSASSTSSRANESSGTGRIVQKRSVLPPGHPSPFERTVERAPQILSSVLSFLGDPVAVCRVKQSSKACFTYVGENEHKLMRDAVRLGGMSMNVRPSFWLWVTLQKSEQLSSVTGSETGQSGVRDLESLERDGRIGKWHAVIERDVARAFGNLPPHKTGARLRTDSIVRALVTWGRNRIMKRGLRGSSDPPSNSRIEAVESDDISLAPTDTVSEWGGVTPAGSFTSSISGEARNDRSNQRDISSRKRRSKSSRPEDLALNGNALTEDVKASLQDKLSCILHALAAAHVDVGYCQGMDYVAAHLLRILQDTVRWKAAIGTLPVAIRCSPKSFHGRDMSSQERLEAYAEVDRSLVVEEACFRVMDSLFTVYNLRHFYWPELRCLKTCCLVFERLIKIKLPVLADHFEHHELNVGLFALGWFQTLFLYLPSMPSATVCHMWDIWMVERSFKIFFRVGTAILFLSQPILLNHELEGMMSYMNTFPDATLLSPDILIACALQIKVTNRLLMQLEREVMTAPLDGGQAV